MTTATATQTEALKAAAAFKVLEAFFATHTTLDLPFGLPFMFMGSCQDAFGRTVLQFKHYRTRNYLLLNEKTGRAHFNLTDFRPCSTAYLTIDRLFYGTPSDERKGWDPEGISAIEAWTVPGKDSWIR